jgi:hypothetical protein
MLSLNNAKADYATGGIKAIEKLKEKYLNTECRNC